MVMLSGAASNHSGNSITVTISAAMSIDGKISTVGQQGAPAVLSSDEDIARVHRLRGRHDAILVGINTILSDDPLLTVRHARRPKTDPARVILDSRARTPVSSRVMRTCKKDGNIRAIIAVSEAAPVSRIKRLEAAGADVIVVAGKEKGKTQKVDLEYLLARLVSLGITSILVEGGGTVNWEFVRRGLFDRIVITVSPYLLGGRNAVSLLGGTGFARVSDSPRLRLVSAKKMCNHMVLTYERG